MVIWAGSRNVVAIVGLWAQTGSGLEGQACSAVVVGLTTRGGFYAGLLSSTPGEAGRASASASDAVMAGRTFGGNVIASVGSGAPSSSGLKCFANTAFFASEAASWDFNAGLL